MTATPKPKAAPSKTPGRKAEPADPLLELPNVGPRIADDLHRLGIRRVEDLRGRDPLALYEELSRLTGVRQDPCVLDTFRAVVDIAEGKPARPWWEYSRRRLAEAAKAKETAGAPPSRKKAGR
jgi:nucleotidyltransferase/DNA polymerase involved in DNA repair